MIEYFEPGELIEGLREDELYPETTELLQACRASPFIEILHVRRELSDQTRSEYIVIDAGDGTVDFGNPGGIRREERLAISVNHQSRVPILVFALRKDFPALSHQHASPPGSPRVLCLYSSTWATVQLGWTPQRFLARMFWWLRESAQLKLHRDDQPLEQLFYMSPYQLILPANYGDYAQPGSQTLTIVDISSGSRADPFESIILKAYPTNASHHATPIRLVPIVVSAVSSTAVAGIPYSLGALQDQLSAWGSDLYKPLHGAVFDAIAGGVKPSAGNGEAILILVWVPRTRGEEVERMDVMGYVLQSSLFDLGSAFEMLAPPDNNGIHTRAELIGGSQSTLWRDIPVSLVEVRPALTASATRDMSGVQEEASDFNGVLAGVGALGSALADMWIRQGWGRWTFVDNDRVMPHNLSRHVAVDQHVGQHKVSVVRDFAQAIFPNEPVPVAIASSILDEGEDLQSALRNAQLIVDVTTTLEAPRALARSQNVPRTASLFVTPSGLSSVMILEDLDRRLRLDALEGQYYRALLTNEWGATHLANHLGDRWVGGGCRDISVRMSIECICSHAGNLSRQLRQSVLQEGARICVWAYDETSGAVLAHEIEVSMVHTESSNGWVIKYDSALLEKLKQTRMAALPNETGGTIVGVTDFQARTIVIVDVLPAPPDSDASPTHFTRGEAGQLEALENVHQRTAGIVGYLGEWHSHPNAYSAQPSAEDEKLLETLHRKMKMEGLPALMMIVAQNDISFSVR
ncbi:ThiF family adenylyltransferase [Pseudomonas neustonica]|uniref:ThiF family adenylyltransferase n=1 Tax=Pseudomonas neustonica TaxID=2487346 RepID=UPI003F44EBEA